MDFLKGKYFDGYNDKPFTIELIATSAYVKIHFVEQRDMNSLFWDHSFIQVEKIPGSTKVYLYYKNNKQQLVEVEAKEFINYVEVFKPDAPYAHSLKIKKNGVLRIAGSLIGFFLFLALLLYFVVLPLTVNLAVKLIPLQTEIDLGRQIAEQTLKSEKQNLGKTKAINSFASQLKTNSKYPIHITVIDKNVKNAFAIPGGEIVVYTGLINEMKDYSELVALLGHEITHVEERHSLRMLVKSLGLYLAVSAIFQDIGGIAAVLVDNASALERLSYNRDLEEEADEKGLKIIIDNNIDPKGMISLFNRLKESNQGELIPEFLLTHPSIESRINTLKEKLPSLKYKIIPNAALEKYWKELKN